MKPPANLVTEDDLRIGVPQRLAVTLDGAETETASQPAGMSEIRVRRHPDGDHVVGLLVIAATLDLPRPRVLALHHSLTPDELDALAEQAKRAADHVRAHNRRAGYRP